MLLLAAGTIAWLLGTRSGLQFTLARVTGATHGALTVQRAEGRLAGPLTLEGLRYHRTDGPDVRIGRLHLDLGLPALLLGTVHLRELAVEQVDVRLPTKASTTASTATGPLDLTPPVNLRIDRARIGHVRVHRGSRDLVVLQALDLAGSWTRGRLSLRQFELRAPDGHAELHGRMQFGSGYPGQGAIHFDWHAAHTHWSGSVHADNSGRIARASITLKQPATVRLEVQLTPRPPFAWKAHLRLPDTDTTDIAGLEALHRLGADLEAEGDRRHARITGTLSIDAKKLRLAPVQVHLSASDRVLVIDHLHLVSPDRGGQLHGHGRIRLDPAPLQAQLHLAWSGVTFPAPLAGQPLASEGTLDASGSIADYSARMDARIGPPGRSSHVQLDLHGSPTQLAIRSLQILQPHGKLTAQGTLTLAPAMGWHLDVRTRQFDPGLLLAGWPGALDARLSTHGQIGAQGTRATLNLETLEGTLRQHPVGGNGTLSLSGSGVLAGHLSLHSGSDTLRIHAAGGTRNDIHLDFSIARLDPWAPRTRGAVQGNVRLRGTWPRLSVSGDLHGSHLVIDGNRANAMDMHLDMPDIQSPGGDLRLHADAVAAAGFAFASVNLHAHGQRAHHALELQAKGPSLALNLALDGRMQDGAWHGLLQRLDLGLANHVTWRLHEPVALHWDHGAARLDPACLTSGAAKLCVQGNRERDGSLHAHYRMHALPLELVVALAANDLRMQATGVLDGTGTFHQDHHGTLQGAARLHSTQGAIEYTDQPGQPLLRFHDLDARLDMNATRQQLQVTAGLQHAGHLKAHILAHGSDHALSGHVDVLLDKLHFVELFTPEVANLSGHLQAGIDLSGTLSQPQAKGQATLAGVSGEIPTLGLKLDQGTLHLHSADGHAFALDGHVRSGTGIVQISGTLGLAPDVSTDIRLQGSNVQVADIPSARVRISPDLDITRGADHVIAIDGSLTIDKADIHLEKLPGSGATQASPDVVVVDARTTGTSASPIPVKADVQVHMGQHTHVVGYGLDGRLMGSLRILQAPGKAPVGQGQIRIDGTFKAYGQDLRIEEGRLLFASSPLGDPGLDIRAVRQLNPNATISNGQVVGLQITGTAQRPKVNVFSNPTMEQSDALSYLVTGKPLSEVRGGEGNMVNSAAQALGSVTGNLLAKGIGSRLGISNIGVSSNDALGTEAFTVGKFLSPRLYLSYGVGLFQPGQVITVRYILSRRWNFEAEQATTFSRASFNYRYEH